MSRLFFVGELSFLCEVVVGKESDIELCDSFSESVEKNSSP